VEEPAHLARRQHHPRGARHAGALVEREGAVDVVVVLAQCLAQRDGVFQRHTGALGQVLQRRVRGITQQHRAPMHPLRNRLAVGGGPALPVARQLDQLAGPRADALEVAQHLFAAALAHAPLFRLAAVEGDDHVVLLAAAQRVVHQVAVRADPDAGRIPAQVGREGLAVDHGAVDHVARDTCLVAHVLAAHGRLHAIGADQRAAAVHLAARIEDPHLAPALLHPLHLRAGGHLHPAAGLHALDQRAVHVGAVDHCIGVAEAGAEGLAGGDAADERFVERVVHHHLVGEDGAAARGLADAQRIEGGKGIGPELDAGADLAQLRRLLQHLHRKAAAGQGQGGGQAADAATGDEDGLRRQGRTHRVSPCRRCHPIAVPPVWVRPSMP
jgi:hypothetical protein